jgi:nucleoside-diphosphate-sugar epimerase
MDAMDIDNARKIIGQGYDGIVDFMMYHTSEFLDRQQMLLGNTDHYIFLSSYRVFDDSEIPTKETSPQLLDTSRDTKFLESDDYTLFKAREERVIRTRNYSNYTIVRPAITYSKKRAQLVTLEREHMLPYIKSGKSIPLPEAAKNVQGTMTWAGDVAEMFARLLFNEEAKCNDFNVTTSEHHSWDEIAGYYKDIFGLNYHYVSEEEYVKFRCAGDESKYNEILWQLRYDRLLNRVMDNEKVLKATHLKPSDLTTLYEGLKREKDTILGRG